MLNLGDLSGDEFNFVARITSVIIIIIIDFVLSTSGYRMATILYIKIMTLDFRTYERLLILSRVSVSVRPRI